MKHFIVSVVVNCDRFGGTPAKYGMFFGRRSGLVC